MDTNLENQSFEEWMKNPPEEYREIFQAIENLHKEMDEGLDRMHQLLFQFDQEPKGSFFLPIIFLNWSFARKKYFLITGHPYLNQLHINHMDPKNLSSVDCVTILVNRTLLKSLSDQCKLFESILKTTRDEMKRLNDEQPEGYKFGE